MPAEAQRCDTFRGTGKTYLGEPSPKIKPPQPVTTLSTPSQAQRASPQRSQAQHLVWGNAAPGPLLRERRSDLSTTFRPDGFFFPPQTLLLSTAGREPAGAEPAALRSEHGNVFGRSLRTMPSSGGSGPLPARTQPRGSQVRPERPLRVGRTAGVLLHLPRRRFSFHTRVPADHRSLPEARGLSEQTRQSCAQQGIAEEHRR